MIHPIYRELTEQQQREFESTLLHAVRNSYWGYEAAKEIIDMAKVQGKFKDVRIGNNAFRENNIDNSKN